MDNEPSGSGRQRILGGRYDVGYGRIGFPINQYHRFNVFQNPDGSVEYRDGQPVPLSGGSLWGPLQSAREAAVPDLETQVRRLTGSDIDALLERARTKQRQQYETPSTAPDRHTESGPNHPSSVAQAGGGLLWQEPAPDYDPIAAWLDDARDRLFRSGQ